MSSLHAVPDLPRETPLQRSRAAERALVAAILCGGAAILAAAQPHADPADFLAPQFREVYTACLAIQQRGEPVTAVTVADEMRAAGTLGHLAILGEPDVVLLELAQEGLPDAGAAAAHARAVRAAGKERAAAALAQRLATAIDRGDLQQVGAVGRELSRLGQESKRARSTAEAIQDASWEQSLDRAKDGQLKRTTANLVTILAHHPAWAGLLRYNEFASRVELQGPAPWPEDLAPQGHGPGPWGDLDDTLLQVWGERTYSVSWPIGAVAAAVHAAARRCACHPVREYFDGLQWDGVQRVELLAPYYLGAGDTPYLRLVSRWWLLGAVARVMRPGAKVDTCPILEGRQGAGKSRAVQILAVRPEWFCDSPVAIGEKDGYQVLQGRLFVEFAELDSWSRADRNRLKAYLSQAQDTYRPPYGRAVVTVLRQCTMVGTTNDDVYLDDPTGARRFLPIRCGELQLGDLERDRDQLWAEALVLYQQGVRWWPEGEQEQALCSGEQEERQVVDSWQERIDEWCRATTEPITTAAILARPLGLQPGQWKRQDEMRVGAILRRLGYVRERRRIRGLPVWVYVHP